MSEQVSRWSAVVECVIDDSGLRITITGIATDHGGPSRRHLLGTYTAAGPAMKQLATALEQWASG